MQSRKLRRTNVVNSEDHHHRDGQVARSGKRTADDSDRHGFDHTNLGTLIAFTRAFAFWNQGKTTTDGRRQVGQNESEEAQKWNPECEKSKIWWSGPSDTVLSESSEESEGAIHMESCRNLFQAGGTSSANSSRREQEVRAQSFEELEGIRISRLE